MTGKHDPATLRALAERIQAGEDSHDFRREIWDALGRDSDVARTMQSLDACEAFRKKLLPVSHIESYVSPTDATAAIRVEDSSGCPHWRMAIAPTEPAARLAAILLALAVVAEREKEAKPHD